MNDQSPQTLRRGWTTGTCATAAAAAAYQGWLTGAFPDPVGVVLPRGGVAMLALSRAELTPRGALAGVIKDAGDDPDITHGALVLTEIAPAPSGSGITFRGGEGVGTVTLPGLPIPPGEPAINPGPRAMIHRALTEIAQNHGVSADVVVTIGIPGGARLAEKTLNGRLGIRGGLSILGTTGIVVPFSCAAWIHSIHRGIDVARAAGLTHLAASTGSVSEAAVQRLYGLSELALIDMGDFIGGTLKYLRKHPVPRLTIAGGFAKLAKLAAGQLFVHSSHSQVDTAALARLLAQLDAPPAVVSEAAAATSGAQVLALANTHGLPLADAVADNAQRTAAGLVDDSGIAVEVIAYDRRGTLIGRAGFNA